MPSADVTSLVFDWNGELRSCPDVAINDETLRDGLQAPSVREPPDHLKQRLIHLMPALGIDAATLGFPAAGPRMLAQCRLLAREVATARLPLALNCAARTLESDLRPIVELANGTGLTIEAGAFIRASAVGQTAGRQRLDQMLAAVEQAVGFGVRNGLAVMFVAEDGSRAHPDTLAALCRAAVRAGARRLCVADTTGFATPAGTARLVRFIRERVIAPSGAAIALDWHGHRDRGLAVANCLAAAAAGVDRVHATALGVGERAGNAEMELVLANLHLLGRTRGDPTRMVEYCRTAAAAFGTELTPHHPVVGADAFRTATGIHAAGLVDALAAGDDELADLLYSGLPARRFGLRQSIAVSAASGRANVRHWLAAHGHDPGDAALTDALLHAAKASDRALTDLQCEAVVADAAARLTAPR